MENRDDKILRYLSGLMKLEEERIFLDELNSSEKLNLRFRELKSSFEELKKSEPEIDDRYFAALLPRIREKIDHPKEKSYGKWIYAFSSIAVAIILMIILQTPAQNSFYGIEQLAKEVYQNADEETFLSYYKNDAEDIFASNFSYETGLLKDDIENIDVEEIDLMEQNTLPIIEDYNVYEEITEEEFNNIYKSLENRKYL